MSCQSIMASPILALKRDQNVGEAIKALLKAGLFNAPVVDDAGKPVGMFGLKQAMALAMPRATDLDKDIDLSFVHDSLADIKTKFGEAAGKPVKDFMAQLPPAVHPDTSLTEVILLLYRNRGFLPVVDKANGKLVGVVSSVDVMAHLVEGV
jgi:CBS domain-containing protein